MNLPFWENWRYGTQTEVTSHTQQSQYGERKTETARGVTSRRGRHDLGEGGLSTHFINPREELTERKPRRVKDDQGMRESV